tara:strand:- start:3551 stop:4204 length:654 start_codon:yes stop_codon:yes gene_type:complete
MLYGNKPVVVCTYNLSPKEMMFWLYCPIKLGGGYYASLPDSLKQFEGLVNVSLSNFISSFGASVYEDSWVYLTAKTLYVTDGAKGNREGWHSDGFMTDDINYIWSDGNPTEFWEADSPVQIIQHHTESMEEMEKVCVDKIVTYPNKTLLRLDQSVLHRVNPVITEGVRTFVKVSFSKSFYGHIGNSINHSLEYEHPNLARGIERNCPTGLDNKGEYK